MTSPGHSYFLVTPSPMFSRSTFTLMFQTPAFAQLPHASFSALHWHMSEMRASLPSDFLAALSTSPQYSRLHIPKSFLDGQYFIHILTLMNFPWDFANITKNHLSRAHCLWHATLILGLLATSCPSTASQPWARFQYYSVDFSRYHHNIFHQSFGMRHHQQMGRNGDHSGNEDPEQSYRATIM